MMSQERKAFKLGPEITQYLLCECCERRLSENGENYFAKFAVPKSGDTAPPALYRILYKSLLPLWNRMGALRFSLGSRFFLTVESDRIFYFAISMFWRGGLDGWRGYQPVIYDNGLMEAMRNFLLGRGCLSGYIVRVVPSFWADKYGAVLPLKHRGKPFFSISMYDFYLEKLSEGTRKYAARSATPIIYSVDSFESVMSHVAMTTIVNNNDRAKNLPVTGDLVSWGFGNSKNKDKES